MPRATTYPTPWTSTGHGSYRLERPGVYRIRYRDDSGEHTLTREYTRRQVEDLLERKHDGRLRGADGLPILLTWDEALTWYLDFLNTKEREPDYVSYIERTLKGLRDNADREPFDVQDVHVERFLNQRAKQLKADGRPGWMGTVNYELSQIRTFFKRLFKGKKLNPADAIVKEEYEPAEKRDLKLKEFEAVYVLAEPFMRDLLLFLLFTGCRIGEASAMTGADVIDGVWHVRGERQRAGRRRERKHGVRLLLPLSEELLVILQRQRRDAQGHFWRRWTKPEPGQPGRRDGYGMPIESDWFRYQIAKLCGKAEIEPFTAHDLRHANATWQQDRGVSLEVIQKNHGHTSIKTTEIYARAQKLKEVAAAQRALIAEVSKAVESAVKKREDAWDAGLGNAQQA